jgi:hypothetical protein
VDSVIQEHIVVKNNIDNISRMNKMNKKGSFLQDNMGSIILVVIVVLAATIIYIQFYYNSNNEYQELRSCNVIGLGNGVCRNMEDTNCYKIGGCPKEQAYCCISLEAKEKSILPATYGGNANYDFTIGYIGPNTPVDADKKNTPPAGCTFDNSYQTSMVCKAGNVVNMPVKTQVINKGRAIITVKATPYYVINDDPNKIYNATGMTTLRLNSYGSEGNTGEANATVSIRGVDAIDGTYIKIYPYAICDTRDCKREDSRGVLRNNPDPEVYMTIKFVN